MALLLVLPLDEASQRHRAHDKPNHHGSKNATNEATGEVCTDFEEISREATGLQAGFGRGDGTRNQLNEPIVVGPGQ